MLNCVIMDSGVSYTHPRINKNQLSGFSLTIHEDGTVDREDDFHDQYGHGTAIYHIVQDLKDDVNFINVKIASIENESIDEDALLAALKFVEEKWLYFNSQIATEEIIKSASLLSDADFIVYSCGLFYISLSM